MVTNKTKHKLKVLAFWQQYGLEAAVSAFGVKERTLYDWKAKLKKGNGAPEALNEKSKRSKTVRQRAKVIRKPKHFIAEYPGHCGSLDTIEKIIHGCRRYVITFTDVYSRFSLAWATTSHASKAAKEFFDLTTFLFPFPLKYVLTDNGSEFKKHFDEELRRLHKLHWHTYPKQPKMNPHAERFNRSLQEEYIDYHEPDLLDPITFNVGLMKHLLWHNTERPHFGLKLQTPVNYIINNNPRDCKMYLTNTNILQTSKYKLK